MKRCCIITGIAALLLINFCCSESKSDAKQTKVLRDASITPANAYTNLFLDSLTLEDFISKKVREDSIALYMRNFYNSRNYSFAWFNESGLTVQGQGFWNAHKRVVKQAGDNSIYDKQLHHIIDTLLSEDTTFALNKTQLEETELRFTKHFFKYVQYAYADKVDSQKVKWHIPRRKLKPVAFTG